MHADNLKTSRADQPAAAPTIPSPLSPSDGRDNLKKGESIQTHGRTLHLFKDGHLRVFANLTQAEAAAQRTGGHAYQSALSNRFLVCYQ